MRTEFGFERSKCACNDCKTNCRFMPGFLIPADLDRLIPFGVDPLKWAETNLLASPGALVMARGELRRINTLVPAVKFNSTECMHLKADGKCDIHEIAPFGCAFFSCETKGMGPAPYGLMAIVKDGPDGLYRRIWEHLYALGKRQKAPEELRLAMQGAL